MQKYWVSSEAGDGINGNEYETFDMANAAIERVYGPQEWEPSLSETDVWLNVDESIEISGTKSSRYA